MRPKLSNLVIRLAESREEREKLFRFRYAIYVEEMGRQQKHANHATRTIEEPFDTTGANFIAQDGEMIVGCIRSNCGDDTDFGEYVDLYNMTCVGPYFPHFCNVNTKLMVSPAYRRTGLMIMLACKAYEFVRRRGMVCDFIDCNKHLERQFTRFGYRPYRNRIQHPEYGDVLPMLLLGVDLEHLNRHGSPLALIEKKLKKEPGVVKYFHENVFNNRDKKLCDDHRNGLSSPDPFLSTFTPA